MVAFSSLPASAQPRVLEPTGRRSPARKDDMSFAARVTRAVSLPLHRVSRLFQPPGKPHPLAAAELHGKGELVDLTGLSVLRLQFDTPREAEVAAMLMGAGARVDSRQPRWVTQVSGPRASPQVLAQVESLARGAKLPTDLARALGLTEKKRGAHSRKLVVPPPHPGFEGVEVYLRGLWVLRLRSSTDQDARLLLENLVDAAPGRRVMDQVGRELVLLTGPALSDVALGRKALLAAWESGKPAQGKRGSIGVWAGTREADHERTFAVFAVANGGLYQIGAELIRNGRKKGTEGARESDGIEWSWTDPETRNHVLFRVKGVRCGGALATPLGMLYVTARTRERCAWERRYLLELMRGVGQSLPPRAKGMVRLLDPE